MFFWQLCLLSFHGRPQKNLKERHFMDRTLTYTVSIEESDLRADQFLSRRGFSSHILTRLRKNMEHLLINGTPSRTNTPLHEGDILTVHIVEEHSSYHVPPVSFLFQLSTRMWIFLLQISRLKCLFILLWTIIIIHWQMLLPGTTVTAAILSFAAQTA